MSALPVKARRSRPVSSSLATQESPESRSRPRGLTCWRETARSSGCASMQSRVASFNRFLQERARSDDERELLAAKLVGRWRTARG